MNTIRLTKHTVLLFVSTSYSVLLSWLIYKVTQSIHLYLNHANSLTNNMLPEKSIQTDIHLQHFQIAVTSCLEIKDEVPGENIKVLARVTAGWYAFSFCKKC